MTGNQIKQAFGGSANGEIIYKKCKFFPLANANRFSPSAYSKVEIDFTNELLIGINGHDEKIEYIPFDQLAGIVLKTEKEINSKMDSYFKNVNVI